ncbi:hypothetical protein [Lewinella sp. 4G2]|uniref:hypothetical protein n=1 Tax=Lewinella sp. 4G2 TaxID=1803372 RepID=UPI0007B4605A|nr:hypothetical protein [Lewinella sp. 4G2]OAV43426.1 hypothetical protein A3850_002460 [Lewinella sp. 4G2]
MKGKKIPMRNYTFWTFTVMFLLFSASTFAQQVGVNTNNPTQTLDVNGKVKIGDDNTTPSNGTIRFDGVDQDFEGYADGEWKSLTQSAGSNLDIPIPGMFVSFGVEPEGIWRENYVDMRETWGNFTVPSQTPFGTDTSPDGVPPGYFFVVENICATGRERVNDSNAEQASNFAFFYVGLRRQSAFGSALNPQIFLSGSRDDSGTKCMTGTRTPLMVLRAGEKLEMWSDVDSQTDVRVVVSGSFVTSLEQYYQY